MIKRRKNDFVSVKFFVLFRVRNCEVKTLLHEKAKVYSLQDTGNISPKKRTSVDAYFIIEISKKFLMIRYSFVCHLLTI